MLVAATAVSVLVALVLLGVTGELAAPTGGSARRRGADPLRPARGPRGPRPRRVHDRRPAGARRLGRRARRGQVGRQPRRPAAADGARRDGRARLVWAGRRARRDRPDGRGRLRLLPAAPRASASCSSRSPPSSSSAGPSWSACSSSCWPPSWQRAGDPGRRRRLGRGRRAARGPAALAGRARRRRGQPHERRRQPGPAPARRGALGRRARRARARRAAGSATQRDAVVRRYSTLAGACFAVVALSGVVNAALRLGARSPGSPRRTGCWSSARSWPSGCSGVAGLVHRRRVIPRLATERTAFARLAAVELLVMGATVGLAVALSRSAPPVPETTAGDDDRIASLLGYPEPAAVHARPLPHGLLPRPAVAGRRGRHARPLRRRGRPAGPPRRPLAAAAHRASGRSAALALVFVTSGGPGVYGRLGFSLHMVQHMALMVAVPVPARLRRAGDARAAGAAAPARDRSFGPRETLLRLVHSPVLAFARPPGRRGGPVHRRPDRLLLHAAVLAGAVDPHRARADDRPLPAHAATCSSGRWSASTRVRSGRRTRSG